jgi:hypothetical protein
MPQVLNIRHLPGFSERRPIIPPGAVYIGRLNGWYRLGPSILANPFKPRRDGSNRDEVIAQYRALVCHQHELMARYPNCGAAIWSAGARPYPAMATCCWS